MLLGVPVPQRTFWQPMREELTRRFEAALELHDVFVATFLRGCSALGTSGRSSPLRRLGGDPSIPMSVAEYLGVRVGSEVSLVRLRVHVRVLPRYTRSTILE